MFEDDAQRRIRSESGAGHRPGRQTRMWRWHEQLRDRMFAELQENVRGFGGIHGDRPRYGPDAIGRRTRTLSKALCEVMLALDLQRARA